MIHHSQFAAAAKKMSNKLLIERVAKCVANAYIHHDTRIETHWMLKELENRNFSPYNIVNQLFQIIAISNSTSYCFNYSDLLAVTTTAYQDRHNNVKAQAQNKSTTNNG